MKNKEKNILEENRSLGWAGVSTDAPEFAKEFITEFRHARLEKREMRSDFLKRFNSEAERRSLMQTATSHAALRFVNVLLPTHTRSLEDIFRTQHGVEWRVFRGRQESEMLKKKLNAQGQIILGEQRRAREAAEARSRAIEAQREKEKREREIADAVHEIFPVRF
jgi:hypothetical protein